MSFQMLCLFFFNWIFFFFGIELILYFGKLLKLKFKIIKISGFVYDLQIYSPVL